MRPGDEILLACNRQAFSEAYAKHVYEICGTTNVNWDAVYETAVKHGVAPLIHRNLSTLDQSKLGMPEAVAETFRLFAYRAALQHEQQTHRLAQLLQTLASYDIDVMLIKGAALHRLVYTQPWYTVSEDIDMVLRSEQPPSPATRAAVAELLNPFAIEWEWETHHDVTLNGVLLVDFGEMWRRAQQIVIGDQPAYVMAPEDMLLTACIGACRKRFFRLKGLCDISEIIATYTTMDWQQIAQRSQAYECSSIVYTALHVTQQLIDCPIPTRVYDNLAVHPIRRRLINRLTHQLTSASLDSLYVFADADAPHERRLSASLVLPYASYTWHQIRQKLHEAYTDWRA